MEQLEGIFFNVPRSVVELIERKAREGGYANREAWLLSRLKDDSPIITKGKAAVQSIIANPQPVIDIVRTIHSIRKGIKP